MKTVLAVLFFCVITASAASAASIKLEVDTKGQDIDSIKIHMANALEDFSYITPAYSGLGEPVEGSANLKHITISGLTPGETYKFIAILKKGDIRSPGSNIVQEEMPVVVIELQAASLRAVETRGE